MFGAIEAGGTKVIVPAGLKGQQGIKGSLLLAKIY